MSDPAVAKALDLHNVESVLSGRHRRIVGRADEDDGRSRRAAPPARRAASGHLLRTDHRAEPQSRAHAGRRRSRRQRRASIRRGELLDDVDRTRTWRASSASPRAPNIRRSRCAPSSTCCRCCRTSFVQLVGATRIVECRRWPGQHVAVTGEVPDTSPWRAPRRPRAAPEPGGTRRDPRGVVSPSVRRGDLEAADGLDLAGTASCWRPTRRRCAGRRAETRAAGRTGPSRSPQSIERFSSDPAPPPRPYPGAPRPLLSARSAATADALVALDVVDRRKAREVVTGRVPGTAHGLDDLQAHSADHADLGVVEHVVDGQSGAAEIGGCN